MARTRHRLRSKTKRRAYWKQLQDLGLLYLVDAEDEEEDLEAAMLLLLARKEMKAARSEKWGPRGPYNASKSDEFFRLLLEHFSERRFRIWMW